MDNLPMKAIFPLFALLFFSGCANTGARFDPANLEIAPNDKALVYFFRPSAFQGGGTSFDIIANGVRIGSLDNGAYLKRVLPPDTYKIHSDTLAIDRISTFVFEPGKIYFIRSFIEMGLWVSSVRFSNMHQEDALYEMRKSRIQLDDHSFDDTEQSVETIKLPNYQAADSPTTLSDAADSSCIRKMKKSAWYSINITKLESTYQAEERFRKIRRLDEEVEKTCDLN